MIDLDAIDRALLERLQSSFPLTVRPFAALGKVLGLDEAGVLSRTRRLKKEDLIRQIGAIFDTRRLGYRSTLVAFHVPGERLESVAAEISAHPGVSHNYARPHHYNLWFTLAVPPDADLVGEIARQADRTGVHDWLDLPALQVFKIKTHFRLAGNETHQPTEAQTGVKSESRNVTPADIPYVRLLQRDLSLVPRPFAKAAAELGISDKELLAKARELDEAGIMRRFSAVLRHRHAGYTANGMACWVVPEDRIQEVGQLAGRFPQVSHCYQRPAHPPRWPYNLFTMIHGQTKNQVKAIVTRIARETGIKHYQVLYSTREFKKERVRYFEEET